ncbi:Glycosyltransferase like family 2 [Actinopolyspora mzabensis]|uniref:4,4'-diaponeurosporenoate glycosyltransferase n=1 Tax=Actinopolyspora mzabensis TaxID=995066 RepID=A0A1G9A2B6_ACTMZ|nr:glycosyltransferase family 2 protein [Actinopolyspora mzabensis]SDK20735.1 Glycosyltransferase like family 2 [Actinopolyspora mzabensis]
MTRRIEAVTIVVPAHDEQALLPECLHSLAAALRCLRTEVGAVRTCVCVVADRCGDATARLALSLADRFDRFEVLPNSVPCGLGELRNRGTAHALQSLRSPAPERTWILHTDADTVVPTRWAVQHVRYARSGVHAVAGRAVVRWWSGPVVRARPSYEALVAEKITADHHRHVYGANLGVRADAFVDADGFPPLYTGEDHGLWARLLRAGRLTRQPNECPVLTSGRTRGRAPGGLATLLHELSLRSGATVEFGRPWYR